MATPPPAILPSTPQRSAGLNDAAVIGIICGAAVGALLCFVLSALLLSKLLSRPRSLCTSAAETRKDEPERRAESLLTPEEMRARPPPEQHATLQWVEDEELEFDDNGGEAEGAAGAAPAGGDGDLLSPRTPATATRLNNQRLHITLPDSTSVPATPGPPRPNAFTPRSALLSSCSGLASWSKVSGGGGGAFGPLTSTAFSARSGLSGWRAGVSVPGARQYDDDFEDEDLEAREEAATRQVVAEKVARRRA